MYAFLLGASFFLVAHLLFALNSKKPDKLFGEKLPVKVIGGFLIFNAVMIALVWLSVVLPPLLQGKIYPVQLEHYTTLIVQGLDLGLLLPLAFVSGVLFIRKKPIAFLITPVYYVFLSFLMTALAAKIAAMAIIGTSVVPVIFIIPSFAILSIIGTIILMKNLQEAGSGS